MPMMPPPQPAGATSPWYITSIAGSPPRHGDYLCLIGDALIPQVLHFYEKGDAYFVEGKRRKGMMGLMDDMFKNVAVIKEPGFYQGAFNGEPAMIKNVTFWADICLPQIHIVIEQKGEFVDGNDENAVF
jgi:hypothetical protein